MRCDIYILGPSDVLLKFTLIDPLTPVARVIRVIRVWPEGASAQLQDCFDGTDWSIFKDDDINTYTSTVLFYMRSRMDAVTTTKQICVCPKQALDPAQGPQHGFQVRQRTTV